MKLAPVLFVAKRSFFGHRRSEDRRGRSRNYVKGAVLGVSLSIVPLTVVMFVADGMIEGITNRYLETSTYHLEVAPIYSRSPEELSQAAAMLGKLPGVRGAYPEMQGPAVVLAPAGRSAPGGAIIRAVAPSFFSDAGVERYLKPISGELAFKRDNDVILGEALAGKLGVKPGDLVSFLTSRESSHGALVSAVSPRLTTLRVRAVASAGYEELDSLWAFVPLSTGAKMLAPGMRRIFIGVKTDAPYSNLAPLQASVNQSLATADGLDQWTVNTWSELEENLWKSFSTTRALLLLIMALAVAVAAVNLSSSLIMLSLERKKDIAILKSSGVSNSQIGLIFVTIGAFTGVIGTAIGLGVGTAISVFINEIIAGIETGVDFLARIGGGFVGSKTPMNFKLLNPSYYLEHIPVTVSPSKLLVVAVLCVGLCILASLLPARKAARLPPLEIFRKT